MLDSYEYIDAEVPGLWRFYRVFVECEYNNRRRSVKENPASK